MDAGQVRTKSSMVALLGTTVVFLAITIVAGYLTRLSLVRKTAWVERSDEVALAIDDCRLYLHEVVEDPADAGAADRLRRAEEQVRQLTADNPRQQERVARVLEMTPRLATAPRGTASEVRSVLAQMAAEEGALLVTREAELAEARDRSSVAFTAGALLTVFFGTLSILVSLRQGRVLARAHQEVQRDRALLRSVVESVSDAVVAVDALGGFVVVNEAARKILGLRPPHDRLPSDIVKYVTARYEDGTEMVPENGPLARTVRGESFDGLVYEITPRERAGQPGQAGQAARGTWVSVSGRPVRDGAGQVAAGVVTMHDVTE
ncbi:MAG: PAS domain-containing protein, partial [Polyangiaceae bacterium]